MKIAIIQATPKHTLLLGALLSAILGVVLTGTAQAQDVYKWIDADGTTHYGSHPPSATPDAQQIKVNASAPSGKADAQAKIEQRKKQFTDKTAHQEAEDAAAALQAQKEKEKQDKEAYKKHCDIYKKNLTVIKENNRIREESESGEIVYLSEEAVAEKMKKAKDFIAKNCL